MRYGVQAYGALKNTDLTHAGFLYRNISRSAIRQ